MKKLILLLITSLLLANTPNQDSNITTKGSWTEKAGVYQSTNGGSLIYATSHKNADISFEIKMKNCANFTFLAGGEQTNIFRFIAGEGTVQYVAWNRGEIIKTSEVATSYFDIKEDQWIPVKVSYKNTNITIEIDKGDDNEFVFLKDFSYDRLKKDFSLNFKDGNISVRNIQLKKN